MTDYESAISRINNALDNVQPSLDDTAWAVESLVMRLNKATNKLAIVRNLLEQNECDCGKCLLCRIAAVKP